MSESLSRCKHGYLVKLGPMNGCDHCHNEHRLNILESEINILKSYDKFKKDEDDKRITELERKNIDHQIKRIADLEKKSISIEVFHTSNQCLETWKTGCEVLIDNIHKKLYELETQSKKPFKCPVCEGSRKESFNLPAGGYYEQDCKSCEGKGIIWG